MWLNDMKSIEFKILKSIKFKIKIDVYNTSGIHVQDLINGYFPVGTHRTIWNIKKEVPNGIYSIVIKVGNEIKTIKVEVTK